MENVNYNKNESFLVKNYKEALKNKEFASLVLNNNIFEDVGKNYTSLLEESAFDLENCKNCKNINECKNKVRGYVYYPSKDGNKLNFYYKPCKYKEKEEEKEKNKKDSLDDIKNARFKNIDTTDGNRVKLIKWIMNFYENYENVNDLKGLYLHGSFGSGKTYLIAALLNELSIKKNASTYVVYFPELLRSIKEDFSIMDSTIDYLQSVDILLIDDIGAENVTEWGRDEILGTILQSRMNNKLTTFFTSNFTIEELEKHLSLTKQSIDHVKARRIIERIKQLTIDMELISKNRRV